MTQRSPNPSLVLYLRGLRQERGVNQASVTQSQLIPCSMLDIVFSVRKATSRIRERNYEWIKKQVVRIECAAWQIAFQ